MLEKIHPQELNAADLQWLQEACEATYTGLQPEDVIRDATDGGQQIWRWNKSRGIVVTQVERMPKGLQLFVVVMAGQEILDDFARFMGQLNTYAGSVGASWVAGATKHKALARLWERQLAADNQYTYSVMEVPEIDQKGEGLEPSTRVQTPEGCKPAYAVQVGDKLCGRNGEQEVTAVRRAMVGAVTNLGLGWGTKVWSTAREEWRPAGDLEVVDPCIVVQLTVTPDHEFYLTEGTLVHNKGDDKKQTVKQETRPWGPKREYLKDAFARADSAFSQSQGINNVPSLDEIIGAQRDAAQGAGLGAETIRQNALASANGDFLSPDSNPYLQGQIDSVLGNINQNFQQNVLPGIQDSASQLGAYGGSRQGIMEARAAQDLNQQAGDIASQLTMQNYMAERANQLNAAQQLLGANQVALQPGQMLSNAYNTANTLPFTGAQNYASLIYGAPQYSTSTQTQTAPGGGGLGGALQGGLGGASVGAQVGGPWGAAIGGGLGAIGGSFG